MAYRSVLRSRERGAPGWGGDVKRSKPFIRSRWTSVKGNTWTAKWNLCPRGMRMQAWADHKHLDQVWVNPRSLQLVGLSLPSGEGRGVARRV